MKLMLKVFLEVRVDPRDFLLAFLSLSESLLFNKELSLSKMGIAVPWVILNEGVAFFVTPRQV